MKHTFKTLAIALAILNSPFSSLNSSAAVPVEWSCDIDAAQPRAVAAYRGETLILECTFTRRGAPISARAASATLYWQTNGMATAWWTTDAAVSGATVSAPFTPAMDPGAEQCTFFFSVADADGTNYRANGRIRFAPSPGVSPNTLMPEPGATINFTGATIVGAPWATLEQIDATLGAYATTQALDEVRALMPDVSPFATTSQVAAVAASIPSLSGYATEAYVQSAVANIPAPDLSVYASRAYADAAASNAQANAISRIPSLSGYATQSYVQNAITNISAPSLDGYASKAYADAAASNAQANAVSRIPSLSGYATETYVQDAVAGISSPDLSGYATRAYADAAASNAPARAAAQIPSLSGYATETYVQYAVAGISSPDLSAYATRAYADAAASNAQARAAAQIPSLSGYATEAYVQGAVANIAIPSLDGYATRAYADAAASNVAAAAASTYITGVPDYYATKSWVRDQVETGGGRYSAGVWSDGYVLDATGVVSAATIITNAIPTPPYMTNTTIIIDGGVTTTVETVTTNYTYEIVTNLAPAFKAFLVDASTSPESAIADAALTGPVFYSDSSRLFFRHSDVLYECDDGTWLEYSNGRWRYSDGGSTYDCINGNGLPANDISPPAILQWNQGGTWKMVTRGSVLETFPLLYNRAGLAPADYETVSNRAMTAVQPGEMTAATNSLSERFIPIEGSEPIITSVLLFLNRECYEQGMLMFALPNGEQSNAVSFVQSSMLTNEGAVVAARAYTDAAVASAVPAGVVVTNESGQIESNLSIMGGISAGGSLQAYNGTFYGLLTVNGTDITDAIAANATGISASAVAATNYTDAATNALAQSMGGTRAEIAVSGTVPYSKGLVNLTVSSGGTLACNTNDWPNGAQVLVSATLPATYTAASGINPVGYSAMPSDGQYLLVFTRLGQAVYVSIITSVE